MPGTSRFRYPQRQSNQQLSIYEQKLVGRQEGLRILIPAAQAVGIGFGEWCGFWPSEVGQAEIKLALADGSTVKQQVGLTDAFSVACAEAVAASNRAATASGLATMNSLLRTKSCCRGTVVSTRLPLEMLGSGKSNRRRIQARSWRLITAYRVRR